MCGSHFCWSLTPCMLGAVLICPSRWSQENSHPLMPPLLLSVPLWVHSHYNPLCSFRWHICREEELIRLFCLAFWTRSGHQLLTTAVSTTLGLSFPIALPLLWIAQWHTAAPHQSPCREKLWNRQRGKFWEHVPTCQDTKITILQQKWAATILSSRDYIFLWMNLMP